MNHDPLGCLLVHGYAGRPFEMRYLERCLAEAGFATSAPVLAGHEGDEAAFSRSRYADWLASAADAFSALRSRVPRVAVIGFSMGGTLALDLAQHHAVDAVVTISAPVFLCRPYPYWSPDWRLFFSGPLGLLRPVLPGRPGSPESRSIAPWEGYEGRHHVRTLHSFKRGAARVRRRLARIEAPILVVHSGQDRSVCPDNAWEIVRSVSSARREAHLLPIAERVTSGHLLPTHTETRDLVAELIAGFLRSLG